MGMNVVITSICRVEHDFVVIGSDAKQAMAWLVALHPNPPPEEEGALESLPPPEEG